MITLAVRLKNLAFLLIAVLALSFLGIRYADLGRYVGVADYYTVDVHLPRTGGLFTHSDVTYRGVSVGRVGPIDLTAEGVVAELRIKKSAPRIPADTKAVVAGLSAVGEQYIDLRPESDGSPTSPTAPASSRPTPRCRRPSPTCSPASTTWRAPCRWRTCARSSTSSARPSTDTATTSRCCSTAAATSSRPPTAPCRPPRCSSTTARPSCAPRPRRRGPSATSPSARRTWRPPSKGSDADLRRLLAVTPEAATQVSGLLRDLDPSLGVVLANLLTTSEVAVTRQRGIEELLVKYPAAVSAGATAVDGGKLDLGLAVTFFSPLPCTDGYGGTRYRNGLDLGTAPALNTDAACTAPASGGRTYAARPTPRRAARSPTRPPRLPALGRRPDHPGRGRLPGQGRLHGPPRCPRPARTER